MEPDQTEPVVVETPSHSHRGKEVFEDCMANTGIRFGMDRKSHRWSPSIPLVAGPAELRYTHPLAPARSLAMGQEETSRSLLDREVQEDHMANIGILSGMDRICHRWSPSVPLEAGPEG